MKKSHRETQRRPEPLQNAGAGRGAWHGHGIPPTPELTLGLSPTRPGMALHPHQANPLFPCRSRTSTPGGGAA